jgi:hypothetical protein
MTAAAAWLRLLEMGQKHELSAAAMNDILGCVSDMLPPAHFLPPNKAALERCIGAGELQRYTYHACQEGKCWWLAADKATVGELCQCGHQCYKPGKLGRQRPHKVGDGASTQHSVLTSLLGLLRLTSDAPPHTHS